MADSVQVFTPKTARGFLEQNLERIGESLTRSLDPRMFMQVALSAMSRQPQLYECTPASLMRALLECGQLGLMPNSYLGLAYLVPFYNKEIGAKEATFIPGYRGLIELARRSGEIRHVQPRTVREGDVFRLAYGSEEKIVHEPLLDAERSKRPLLYVYSVATFTDGLHTFDLMTKAEVELVRARSRAKDSGPWKTDYEAMCWKTVIRRHAKFLPQNPELDRAMEADTRLEAGDAFEPLGSPEAGESPLQARTAAVRDKIRVHRNGGAQAAAGAEPAEWEDVTGAGGGGEGDGWTPGDDFPDLVPPGGPAAAERGAAELEAFGSLAFEMEPKGGGATEAQRGRLRELAGALYRPEEEEFERLLFLAGAEALGKGQVGKLIAAGMMAADARGVVLPSQQQAAGAGTTEGDGGLFPGGEG